MVVVSESTEDVVSESTEDIEDADIVSGPGAPKTFGERLIARGDGVFVVEPLLPSVPHPGVQVHAPQ